MKALPNPPADFSSKKLPCKKLSSKTYLFRTTGHSNPLFFGRLNTYRFDCPPPLSFGAFYGALSPNGAFLETFCNSTGVRTVSIALLKSRKLFAVWAKRDLKLANLHGKNLTKLGLDARIFSGDYKKSKIWARAIWEHSSKVDGIMYPTRHDETEFAVALFDDRVKSDLSYRLLDTWWDFPDLNKVVSRYDIHIV